MADNNEKYYDLLTDLVAEIDQNTSFSVAEYAPDVPREIRLFLGGLGVLQNVPFHYLLPDINLVPVKEEISGNGTKEEIGALRFFWLDPLWVQSLLDGALSLGESHDASYLLEKAMAGNYVAEVFQKETINRLKEKLGGSYNPGDLKKKMLMGLRKKGVRTNELDNVAAPSPAQENWRYTGFLLRSSIVSGYVGLEVTANGVDAPTDKKIRPLSVIRMERLADDTLFCLCEGIIKNVEIKQPAEGIHFGTYNDGEKHQKLVNGEAIDIPFRSSANKRTLNIDQGSAGLISQIKAKALPEKAEEFTSAHMAKYMLSKPVKYIITINWEKENE